MGNSRRRSTAPSRHRSGPRARRLESDISCSPARRARAPAAGRDPRSRSDRRQVRVGIDPPRTVSSGTRSSSGLNQDAACFQRANRICTCCRRAFIVLSRWSSSYGATGSTRRDRPAGRARPRAGTPPAAPRGRRRASPSAWRIVDTRSSVSYPSSQASQLGKMSRKVPLQSVVDLRAVAAAGGRRGRKGDRVGHSVDSRTHPV